VKDLNELQIEGTASISDAFEKIERNHQGLILVVDNTKRVIGLATDGDIRRYLMKGHLVEDSIVLCMNRNFTHGDRQVSRESLLKLLDHKIRLIPILSEEGKLLDIYSRDHFPLNPQDKVYARAKSPARISFGGGGTDVTHYFVENGGAVINATISIYSHAVLKKRGDEKIRIYSNDLSDEIRGDNLNDILETEGKFDLICSLLKLISPDYGFDLEIGSDFPMSSGLGGSAVILSAIIGCFNQFRQDKWDRYEIAEIAFQAERLTLNMAGGWQDQYATTFGGVNFMEFDSKENIVHPLKINEETLLELEESLVLCNTGIIHNSGEIHQDQKQALQQEHIKKLVKRNKELTFETKNYLLRGRLADFGKALHEAWILKRQFSEQISSSNLDEIYNFALENGAVGGKLLGAGGGGFFLFYVPPFKKYQLIRALEKKRLSVNHFTFDNNGLQAWTVRIMKNKND
jgi:D-glycero-alpha-D-manno-heptose-7-phosphate kinase